MQEPAGHERWLWGFRISAGVGDGSTAVGKRGDGCRRTASCSDSTASSTRRAVGHGVGARDRELGPRRYAGGDRLYEPVVDRAGVGSRCGRFGFSTHGGYPGRYSDTLFAAKFSNPSVRSLSSFIYDASLYVYDDDRDLFVEINCADEALLAEAVATFHAITPVTRTDVIDGSVLYIPNENPSAKLLLEAGEAVASQFEGAGYRRMASERSQWQLKGKV